MASKAQMKQMQGIRVAQGLKAETKSRAKRIRRRLYAKVGL